MAACYKWFMVGGRPQLVQLEAAMLTAREWAIVIKGVKAINGRLIETGDMTAGEQKEYGELMYKLEKLHWEQYMEEGE